MIHLVIAFISFILFASGQFPVPVTLALLAITWIAGAKAFQHMNKSENRKLAAYGQEAQSMDPLACPHFESTYISHYDTKEEGLTDYITVMLQRKEIVFYGYIHKDEFNRILRGKSGRLRVYHEGPFVLRIEQLQEFEPEEEIELL